MVIILGSFNIPSIPLLAAGGPTQKDSHYWDNGKENGNYYTGLYRDYRLYIGVILG